MACYHSDIKKRGALSIWCRKSILNKLFFALKGENFDGNTYALNAIEKGASAAIVDQSAKAFHDLLQFDGIVLTKMDGDTRGGA